MFCLDVNFVYAWFLAVASCFLPQYLPGCICSPEPHRVMPLLLQVVRTTVQPLHTGPGSSYDAYEYVVHSHTYISDQQPTAKFSYGLSALQVGNDLTALLQCLESLVLSRV